MAKVGSPVGAFIRRQRELSEISMRQFATMAGISNPYLSQIERGLRAPSEEVLEAIASSLKMSADTLRTQAGIAPETESPVVAAIKADERLTSTQRRALLEVYKSFVT
jgi:transcriptional regulator with XRE-family HTH domain